MKRLAAAVLIALVAIVPGTAFAERGALTARQLISIIQGSGGVIVPPEWEGRWTVTDSSYNCLGVFQNTSTSDDTVCAGAVLVDPEQSPTPLDCSGTSNATSFTATCTGSDEVFTDCLATFTYEVHGTRTGDSYFSVATLHTTFSGTGEGCDALPEQCFQFNSHGVRTGAAPPGFCTTPTLPQTWGKVKVRYR